MQLCPWIPWNEPNYLASCGMKSGGCTGPLVTLGLCSIKAGARTNETATAIGACCCTGHPLHREAPYFNWTRWKYRRA